MTEFEEYQEHIRYKLNAFYRIVIHHASIDAARKLYSGIVAITEWYSLP